eukprot:CAMPEP_0202891480 /NCGR_PEP_ID=MMETSP1392-20130828/1527_1 /ASSEMBLY_ACC=CAM_ASM_000868 /TAXON_ID=225041 /ORGANISM="Chlamydomonas chlamydogama, Strain SAG 11-48b" /LENGTH=317 /DNA_ID=CAMNT_0049575241 /DNA_START=100 /DNA_END=1053 /DNA_ORIENTATION=+
MTYSITEEQALSCCASKAFAAKLAAASPFADFGTLVDTARRIWWSEVGTTEWLDAFAAHPKIGDHEAVEQKPAAFAAFSKSEQAAAAESTTSAVAEELRELNKRYYDKFGFIFIIFAKGKSAPEILSYLRERYNRLPYEELQTAAREQMKITELRLGNLFGLSAEVELMQRTQRRADQVLSQLTASHAAGPLRSPITTHVLDSALGVPAMGLPLALLKYDETSKVWEKVSEGVTNEDGRVGNLLAPSNYLAPGRYRMYFDTATYLHACKKQHPNFYAEVPFYPEVNIEFVITPDKSTEHYHIPLLLSPYGYSTYRGS